MLFSVDMFNEGLDVPTIDTVLLLRPTSSPVVFLQQLGRGLRLSEGKTHLSAIDFIGNHKSFLSPARVLLGLGSNKPMSDRQLTLTFVTEWTAERGVRPTALQAWNAGFNPASAPTHWLGFLRDNDFLSPIESRVVDHNEAVLQYVTGMNTTKSYKLVALRSLLQGGTLTRPMGVSELAESSLRMVRRDPRLQADVTTKEIPGG